MDDFATIWARAAERKGGDAVLEALMPEGVALDRLAAVPDDRWLSAMAKRVFQAGFVWRVIENKWDGFEAAFHGFDPGRLAMMPDDELDALLRDTRIVRNGQKIRATRDNAVFLCDLANEHGSAGAFFANWPDDDYIGLLDVMKKRGARLGGMTGQIFLRSMGKDSFILNKDVSAALVAAGVVDKAPTSKAALQAVQRAFNQWRASSGRSFTHISRTLACSIDA